MLAEACSAGIIARESARLLKKKPEAVARLSRYWTQAQSILDMNILILDTDQSWLHQAQRERAAYGLLTNDSLIVAAMREHGLRILASTDGDFDGVSGLVRYEPSDLPQSTVP